MLRTVRVSGGRVSVVVVLTTVLALSLSGCSLIATQLATDFNLELEPAALTIAPGGVGEVTIKVTRIVPVDLLPVPIDVTLYDPPEGVTLEDSPVDIPSGLDDRQLKIHVSSGATIGGPVDVIVEGTNGLKTKHVTLELTIATPAN